MKDKIITIVFYFVVFGFFTLMIGSLLYKIPLLGDASTSLSGGLIHIWIIVAAILVAISLICLIKEKNKNNSIIFTINMLSFIICVFLLFRIMSAFKVQGSEVSFFKTYYKENISKVITEKNKYVDSNEDPQPINLYYMDNKNNKPVIVYIHGGGWISGSENKNEYTSKVLAKNGFVVASIGYELSNENKHLWDRTEKQILYGLLYLKEHLNTNEVFMIGDSAGGNLALDISYKISDKTYTEINNKVLPSVKAVSVNYPVAKTIDFYNNTNVMSRRASKKMANSYLGGSPEEYPERYKETSPQNYISKDTPPTFIILGENDALVPPESTYSFIEILNNNGIKNKLIKVPYFGHASDIYNNNLFNQAYINYTIKWFSE